MIGIPSVAALFGSTLAQAGTPAPGGGGGLLGMLLPFILIFVVMYFLMIRPQQKKQKVHQQMIAALKPGDEVVTAGGLYGTVAGMDDRKGFLYLKIANDVKIKVERFSIARVVTEEADVAPK